MNIILFSYNFPHKKTQDFIYRLLVEGIQIRCVLAADAVELNMPKGSIRTKFVHTDMVHPKKICDTFKIPYYNVIHNSEQCCKILKEYKASIGLISGARILKQPVIDCFDKGIINIHPGILPEIRGLDALKWAVLNNLPIGATAHLIDNRIDAGRIIKKEIIDIYKDDTIRDVALRLEQIQNNMLAEVVEAVFKNDVKQFKELGEEGNNFGHMPREKEEKLYECFKARTMHIREI